MATDRIRQLEKFYEEDPADPFNIYALALEYREADPSRAKLFFDALLEKHHAYLPTYYHAAQFFQWRGEREKAVSIFEQGIALARKLDDKKTLRELQSAYDELLFE